VKPGDLSKIDKAFFDLNGYISLAFFVAVVLAG
jgi:4-hydroxybenzoate polyprenyltransferase